MQTKILTERPTLFVGDKEKIRGEEIAPRWLRAWMLYWNIISFVKFYV